MEGLDVVVAAIEMLEIEAEIQLFDAIVVAHDPSDVAWYIQVFDFAFLDFKPGYGEREGDCVSVRHFCYARFCRVL